MDRLRGSQILFQCERFTEMLASHRSLFINPGMYRGFQAHWRRANNEADYKYENELRYTRLDYSWSLGEPAFRVPNIVSRPSGSVSDSRRRLESYCEYSTTTTSDLCETQLRYVCDRKLAMHAKMRPIFASPPSSRLLYPLRVRKCAFMSVTS